MNVTVAFVNPPKPGKKLGTIKDQHNNYHYYDPSKFSPIKGDVAEITTEDQEFQGKVYSHIRSYKAEAHYAPSSGGNVMGGKDRWYMPFVSNTVAHAISMGLLNDPEMIGIWAKAAKQAAEELDKPARATGPDDIDSDLPF